MTTAPTGPEAETYRNALLADAPLLDELMPWSVAPLRLGRGWVMAPDAGSLRRRWDALVGAADEAAREALFEVSRSRGPRSTVARLPGQRAAGTGRIAHETGRCPEPVRVLHGAYDEQWLLPDNRLIDAARPELWRVLDTTHQLFAVEQGPVPRAGGPALTVTAHLPDGRSPAGRPGRIRPLYRRPGGLEPNLAPGLTGQLADRYGLPVTPRDLLCWITVAAHATPRGCAVPLTADPAAWAEGVALGRRLVEVQLRGAHGLPRPKLPGGRRPYVRAAIPAHPDALSYDPADETLLIGPTGRVSPVPAAAWEAEAGGVRVLEQWFARRTAPAEAGTLEALRPASWPQEWTSELLELITVLALLAELGPRAAALATAPPLTATDLHTAGILPAPAASHRPASVLDPEEEGPGGQLTLV